MTKHQPGVFFEVLFYPFPILIVIANLATANADRKNALETGQLRYILKNQQYQRSSWKPVRRDQQFQFGDFVSAPDLELHSPPRDPCAFEARLDGVAYDTALADTRPSATLCRLIRIQAMQRIAATHLVDLALAHSEHLAGREVEVVNADIVIDHEDRHW